MFDQFPACGNVVVQGANRGIGLEWVRQCVVEPRVGHVIATCRAPDEAAALASLRATTPHKLSVLRLDVTDEASIRHAAHAVTRVVPRVHLLVNCSGVLHDATRGITPEKRLADVRPESLAYAFSVNATGPLLVARHFEPLLAHDERAVFASLSAKVGSIGDNRLGGWHAYRASKAAQNQLTRTLSWDGERLPW
jgi:NAD(P)-dependent dehydrogenase (short-subunit alcohol dehydrogenase family)